MVQVATGSSLLAKLGVCPHIRSLFLSRHLRDDDDTGEMKGGRCYQSFEFVSSPGHCRLTIDHLVLGPIPERETYSSK
jgi:hypothetical protein